MTQRSVLTSFPQVDHHQASGKLGETYDDIHGADLVRLNSIVPGPAVPNPAPKLRKLGWNDTEIERLKATLDLLNYGNPKYLILITAFNEAWHERNAGGRNERLLHGRDAKLIPYGYQQASISSI